MGGFYRKKGGTQEMLTKERIIFRPGCFLGERVFNHAHCTYFLRRVMRAHLTDYFTGVDQKISDWLMKVMFMSNVEAAIRSGIKV